MPRVAVYVVLPLVIVLAAVTRWTAADVTLRLSGATYDEAVYATAARLFLHGILPTATSSLGIPLWVPVSSRRPCCSIRPRGAVPTRLPRLASCRSTTGSSPWCSSSELGTGLRVCGV